MEIVKQIQCLLKEKICSEKTEVGVKGGERRQTEREKDREREERKRATHTLEVV